MAQLRLRLWSCVRLKSRLDDGGNLLIRALYIAVGRFSSGCDLRMGDLLRQFEKASGKVPAWRLLAGEGGEVSRHLAQASQRAKVMSRYVPGPKN